MKLLQRPYKRIIAISTVLIVLTFSVSVFSVSAAQSEDRDNAAVRLYKALSEAISSRSTATTECAYMPCIGDSMYPTIEDGDNVKVQFYSNECPINVGDIIVYNAWMIGVTTKGMWIGHRVTAKYKQGDTWYFRTKGDNCPEADGWKVPESAVLGKVISIEHTERSYVATRTTSDSERATYPTISLPQGSETFLLITGSFCLGALIAVFDHLKQKRHLSILKKANIYSCYSCRYCEIQYTYRLESTRGKIGLCKTLDLTKGFCGYYNLFISSFNKLDSSIKYILNLWRRKKRAQV